MPRTIPPGRAVTFLVMTMGALLITTILALLVTMAEAGTVPLATGTVLAAAFLRYGRRAPRSRERSTRCPPKYPGLYGED